MASASAIADTKAIQEMLRAAGYDIPVDGIDGPATQHALQQYNASKNAAAAARAKADTAAANARAEEAKAKADQIKAEADAKRIAADEKKRADAAKAESSKRIFDTGITATAYATGVAAGAKTAATIDKKVAAGLANKNAELARIEKQLKPLLKTVDAGVGKAKGGLVQRTLTKIGAIVETADKIGLTKVARGPAGPVAAIGMLAIGAGSRYASTKTDNETIKTVLNASGTAEMIAGAVVGVKDLANRAAPTKTVSAKSLSVVEQARALVANSAGAEMAAKAPSLASRVLRGALRISGKVAIPLTVGVAAFEAVEGYQKDGARGAVRGALSAVDPTSLVMEKGFAERLVDRFAGSAGRSAAAVSSSRAIAGRRAAHRAEIEQRTPMAVAHPASAAPRPAVSGEHVSTSGIHHGWTDAARIASQKARGVQVSITPSR